MARESTAVEGGVAPVLTWLVAKHKHHLQQHKQWRWDTVSRRTDGAACMTLLARVLPSTKLWKAESNNAGARFSNTKWPKNCKAQLGDGSM